MSPSSLWRVYRHHIFCYLLAMGAICLFFTHANTQPRAAAIFPNLLLQETLGVEASMQEKAEKVLEGFGESEPVAVVTADLEAGYLHRESYEVDPDRSAIESEQMTEEALNRDHPSDPNEKKYANRKRAINHLVSQTKTLFESRNSRLKRLNCLVQISENNAHRANLIERSLEVALGLKRERGDQVLVVVK